VTIEHIHLDPVGGIAGDMFAAALAAAFPGHAPAVLADIGRLPAPAGASAAFRAAHDHGLAGQRFVVEAPRAHAHASHRDIRAMLFAASLPRDVLAHAIELFARLAHAEARIHAVAPDDVVFHEVGAWDSIADVVAAASFIAKFPAARWTCAPLPLGSGRVRTAHGVLPVPAPATALLLEGLAVSDDGVGGERVTPTGAAIVRYLADLSPPAGAPLREPRAKTIAASGHGFGTRTLDGGVPNVLRCIAFESVAVSVGGRDEEIATLHFEIDDQTAEDLAVALDRIRAAPGVLDASQLAIVGKKARLATQVQVLLRPEVVDAVVSLCLAETTTLGVRIGAARRRTLQRSHSTGADGVRVKTAVRPGDRRTAKAEMGDLARVPGARAEREAARERAETNALQADRDGSKRGRD
jgi:uncharacterized protein (TIGR00299 family) protein